MFGKDARVLGSVGSFRQISGKFGRNKYEKRDRAGIPYFINAYRPLIGELDTVRLIPGDYPSQEVVLNPDDSIVKDAGGKPILQTVNLPYVYFVDHYDGKTKKGAICSGGSLVNYKEFRDPCHGCDIFWETAQRNSNGRIESTRMGKQNKYALSTLDYGMYHKLEQYDQQTGLVKINPQTKEPYFNWTKCQGQGCDACRAQKEIKQGDTRHWPMSYTEFQILRDAEAKIGRSCVVCQQKDVIQSRAWTCRQCGDAVIDLSNTSLKKEEIQKACDNEVICPHCSFKGFLSEVYECPACAPRGAQGIRATLFDVDMQIQLVEIGDKKILQIIGWSPPYPLGLNPLVQATPKLGEPVPLLDIFKATPLNIQAERFGVVAQPGAGRPPAQPYGAPAPHGYAPPPQGYVPPAPQGFAPQPQYAPPQGFAPPATPFQPPLQPQGQPQYAPAQGYAPQAPYAPPAQGYAPAPQQQAYAPPPQQYAPPPAAPAPAPQQAYRPNPYAPQQ